MPNPYRLVALGVLGAVGVGLAGHVARTLPAAPPPAPPALLPAAYANPAELAFRDTLHRGETLTQLLLRTRLAEQDAQALLAELRKHQNPRHLRAGAEVAYRTGFEDGQVHAMQFRLDADRTLQVARASDGRWQATVEQVPVRTDTVVLSGEVTSSLYGALVGGSGNGVPAEEREAVADVLAEKIFAWQVDFSRDLRRGDRFRILYERLVRPDGTARSSRVLGVSFDVGGRERTAFLFRAPDGSEDYYDRDGESLRRSFLRAPLEFRRISSVFSTGRFHPILKVRRAHHGIDYAAASGTPVRAVGDGLVTQAGWSGGYGNVVEIRHSRGYSSKYAHLKGFASGLRRGQRVKQGQLIGYVGSTGLSTGPHLHYEFREGGRPINPSSIRHLTGEPVGGRYRDRFRYLVRLQTALMERLSADSSRLARAAGAQTNQAE